MKIPKQLKLVDGELRMMQAEEISVREYLRSWQHDKGIEDGLEVCVISRDCVQNLVERNRELAS